jgi:hypothetical protein
MSWTRLSSVALVVAVVAACGGEATDGSTTTVPASTTTEAAVATTTTVPAPTTTVAPTTTQTLDEANRPAWQLTASDHRGEVDTQYDYECPGPGFLNSVWGTDIYTDDSSVCSAAVHAGLITFEVGGNVTIEMRAGETSYAGSESNGVTSGEWGQWHSSYVFVD